MPEQLLIGLGTGATYALIALGYSLVYGVLRLVNFAHGEFFMVGGYVGYFALRDRLVERLGLPFPLPLVLALGLALSAAALAAGALSVLTERVAYRPLRGSDRNACLITAVCVSLILQNVAIKLWGGEPRAYPEPARWAAVDSLPRVLPEGYRVDLLPDTVEESLAQRWNAVLTAGAEVGGEARRQLRADGIHSVARVLPVDRSVAYGASVLALCLGTPILLYLVRRTRAGRAMRAVSEDQEAAQLMGIDVDRVVSWTFFVGGLVAGVGGVLACIQAGVVEPFAGFLPGLKAFAAAVLGGIGSISGAILGGLLLGFAEVLVPYLLEGCTGWSSASAWKDSIAFALLILVLLVRPTGLLGATEEVRV